MNALTKTSMRCPHVGQASKCLVRAIQQSPPQGRNATRRSEYIKALLQCWRALPLASLHALDTLPRIDAGGVRCSGLHVGPLVTLGITPEMTNQALQAAFGNEMHRIYQRALSEASYKATRFLHMLHEHGGLQTAQILIHATNVSEGF